MKKRLADRIRMKRLQMELTQQNMADELRISGTAYSNIERAITDIKMSRLFAIAVLLNCSPSELLADGPTIADPAAPYGTDTDEVTLLRQQVNLLQKEFLLLKQDVNSLRNLPH